MAIIPSGTDDRPRAPRTIYVGAAGPFALCQLAWEHLRYLHDRLEAVAFHGLNGDTSLQAVIGTVLTDEKELEFSLYRNGSRIVKGELPKELWPLVSNYDFWQEWFVGLSRVLIPAQEAAE